METELGKGNLEFLSTRFNIQGWRKNNNKIESMSRQKCAEDTAKHHSKLWRMIYMNGSVDFGRAEQS